LFIVSAWPVAQAQDPLSAPMAAATVDRRAEQTRVSVDVDKAPLRSVLALVARQAGLKPAYDGAIVPEDVRITLHVRDLPVDEVFQQVLNGTGLVAQIKPAGTVFITKAVSAAATDGTIVGVVIDASTKRPVVGAFVTLDESRKAIQTRNDGSFRIANVAAGTHKVVVRRLGYRVSSTPVTVEEGTAATISVALTTSTTTLNEVVTTATGDRRRLEVGNAIATIKADSIVPTTLIRNLSDLLQARVPGVIVQNMSGEVGAPSKIRIRGLNSLVLNNDPIVILDGVRVNAQTSVGFSQTNTSSYTTLSRMGNTYGNVASPSPLDDIDPNSIESIDVLRGPSASSLYGTDAANGVIVIKTKKGHPGGWHADFTGDNGWSAIAGKLNDLWWGFGKINGYTNAMCYLAVGGSGTVAGGTCTQDSVRNFNYENDPEMSTMGTGTARSLGGSLSGGTDALLQFFSLRGTSDVGMSKMSDVQQRLIARLWSTPAPSWMVHPNTQQEINGMSQTTFKISPQADVAVSANAIYRDVLNGGSGITIPNQIGSGMSPSDTLGFLPSDQQRTKVTTLNKRGVLSTTGHYSLWSWLATTGTVGGDYALTTDGADLRAQDCNATLIFVQNGPSGICPSGHNTRRNETLIKTANVSAQLSFAPASWLTLRTSLGEQYNHTSFYSLQVGNNINSSCNLAFGTSLLSPGPVCLYSGAQAYLVNEQRDAAAKAGVYLEESVSLFGLYTTFGIRRDVASGFGGQTNKTPPNYPKFDFSYPLSEQSFFPKQSVVSSLRLRLAYGQSGNQASQTGVLNQYALQQEFYGSSNSTNVVYMQSLGNPDLRPERGTEWEGGFDVTFLQSERLRAEVNLYRKFTRDAINYLQLASSYGMENSSIFVNLGNVVNRGVELSGTARILDSRALGWEVTMNWSHNTNKLVHKAASLPTYGFGLSRNVEGYPLFGYWGPPVVSYADANHNGILEQSEIIFGAPVYQGSPEPKSEMTYVNNFTLFNGSMRVNANFNQVNGLTNLRSYYGTAPRGAVDPTAPLAEQAGWIQAYMMGGGQAVYMGEVSFLRFNELSVTYTVPPKLLQRYLRAHALGITLAARNLALWTDYVGKDPNINTRATNEEMWIDEGTGVPQPRNVTLRFNLSL